jgi:hypothetical protein
MNSFTSQCSISGFVSMTRGLIRTRAGASLVCSDLGYRRTADRASSLSLGYLHPFVDVVLNGREKKIRYFGELNLQGAARCGNLCTPSAPYPHPVLTLIDALQKTPGQDKYVRGR